MPSRYEELRSLWPLALLAFLILVSGYAGYWPAVPLAERPKARAKLLNDDTNRVRVEWLVKAGVIDGQEVPVSGQIVADHRVVSAAARSEGTASALLKLPLDPAGLTESADLAFQTQPELTRVGERFFCMWQYHPTHLHGAGQCILGSWSDDGLEWEPPFQVFNSPGGFGAYLTGDRLLCSSGCLSVDGHWYAVASMQEVVGFGSIDATTFEEAIAVVESADFPRPVRKILAYVVRRIQSDGSLGPVRTIWKSGQSAAPEHSASSVQGDEGGSSAANPEEPLDEVDRTALDSLVRRLATADSRFGGTIDFPVPERLTLDRYRLSFPTMVTLPDQGQVRLWGSEQGLDRLYSEHSADGGVTWSAAMPTNLRNFGRFAVLQRLSSGPVLLVGNQSRMPVNVADPLTISIAFEGLQFTESFDLRSGAPLLESADGLPEFARSERRGFQATSCVVDDDWLWVVYSVCGSSIEVSRVSLLDLIPSLRESDRDSEAEPESR